MPPKQKGDDVNRITPVLLLVLGALVTGCATSRSTPPGARAALPQFEFHALKGHTVRLTVLDHRAEASDSGEWVSSIRSDLTSALTRAGVTVSPSGDLNLEARLLEARSDFERSQWKGCAKIAAEVDGSSVSPKATATAEKCVTKSNLWGYATAHRVLTQAYEDALSELLSNLDHDLR
jgi:hypothetical protein